MHKAKALGQDLLSGFALLTRVKMPAHSHQGAGAAWTWPVVGLVVGTAGAALIALGQWLGMAPGPLAAFALALMAMLTGGLHEDGLADTADGLFGGRSAERRLEIMKDSHIGSFGTLALVLLSLAAWSALSDLIAQERATAALLAASALSRAPMAALMAALPPARKSGISASSGRPSAKTALCAVLMGAGLALIFVGGGALIPLLVVSICSLALGLLALGRIGGQTGDILGASQQIAFAASLALLA